MQPLATLVTSGEGADTHGEDEHRRWLGAAGYGVVDVVHLEREPESLLLAAP